MTPRAAKLISRGILAALVVVFAAQFVLRLSVGDRLETAEIVVVGDPQAPGMAQVRSDLEADLAQGARFDSNIFEDVLIGVFSLMWGITGSLIVSRQPRNKAGWIFCIGAAAVAVGGFALAYTTYSVKVSPSPLPAQDLVALIGEHALAFAVLIPLLVLLFPDGSPPSPRWRWATRAILAGGALAVFPGALTPGPLNNFVQAGILYANPLGVAAFREGGLGNALVVVGVLLLIGASLATVIAVWQRFRRARGEERQQMRWLVAVATVAGAGIALILLAFPILALLGQEESSESDGLFLVFFAPTLIAIFLGIPAAYLVAIFRYRLWELDVVIKKAAVAFALTLLLVGVGVFVIYVPGQMALWGGNELGVMLGVIAGLLIWPVVRLARWAARRIVFGRRADPYEVLTEFSGRMGETYATEDVLPRMAQILAQGTGASVARVWLLVGGELRPEASWPADSPTAGPLQVSGDLLPDFPDESAFDVLDGGRLLGALSVSMPASDPMNPAKEKLVRDLASQAVLVLRNVRLIEELRASRQRLVVAQDEERRKLERNIHDGAQQQLVALTVQLGLLKQQIERDPPSAKETAERLRGNATTALEDLRDLARGIYPPLLAAEGLTAALQAQASRSSVPVAVEADRLGRFPREVEAAVYFCVLEALQNVAKYAHASHASVRLSNGAAELSFEVEDDGAGFDVPAAGHGTGLQGMADRLAAVGGAFSVHSEPGAGTTVTGKIPVEGGR
jgi:signal transduction histidine kinase